MRKEDFEGQFRELLGTVTSEMRPRIGDFRGEIMRLWKGRHKDALLEKKRRQ